MHMYMCKHLCTCHSIYAYKWRSEGNCSLLLLWMGIKLKSSGFCGRYQGAILMARVNSLIGIENRMRGKAIVSCA